MTDVEPVVAFLRAAHEKAEAEAPHVHLRGCSAWDDYHYRRELTDLQPTAGDACDCEGPRSALARVQAEKAVIETWQQAHGWNGGRDGALIDATLETVIEHLAHGHRFTIPGFDPGWTPEGADT